MAGTRMGYLTRVIRYGPQKQPAPRVAVLVHGTTNGYTTHACRCEGCRKAHADAMRAYRHRPKTWPDWAHGRNGTYLNGCRCAKCRKAHTAYRRRWAATRRQPGESPLDRRRVERLEYFRKRHQEKKGKAA